MKLRNLKKYQRGISMMEVMAFLIIAGIAGMKMSQNNAMKSKSAVVDYAALSANTVANAAKKYRLQYGAWPTSTAQLVSASYLSAAEAISPFGTPYTFTTSGTYLVVSNAASDASYAKRLKGVLQNGTVSGSTYTFSFQPSGWEVSLAGLYRLDGSEPLKGDMNAANYNIRNVNNLQSTSVNTGSISASNISTGSLTASGSITAGGTVRGGSLVSDSNVTAPGTVFSRRVETTGDVAAGNVVTAAAGVVTPYLKVHGAGADITTLYSQNIINSSILVSNEFSGKSTYSDHFHGGTFIVYNSLTAAGVTTGTLKTNTITADGGYLGHVSANDFTAGYISGGAVFSGGNRVLTTADLPLTPPAPGP